ncbi:hypothetical protein [Nioella ostreopsis]|uniref:hypothetical protein n=1 Tax=Nioella ostreopsis TaxID=2448479 RepID=UPI000FDA50A7|nr:hypothetical protein [Nioella ostreopsis]
MSRVVTRSINDQTGLRCLDLVQTDAGSHIWLECRRDPEDSHGWRVVFYAAKEFASVAEAWSDARERVAWLDEEMAE